MIDILTQCWRFRQSPFKPFMLSEVMALDGFPSGNALVIDNYRDGELKVQAYEVRTPSTASHVPFRCTTPGILDVPSTRRTVGIAV
jgi:hypothetical protein